MTLAFFRPSILIQEKCPTKFVKSGVFNCLKKEEILGNNNLLFGNINLVFKIIKSPLGTFIKQFILDPEGVTNYCNYN